MKFENEQEAQVLINLINEAVKVKGLEAAEIALHFLKKIKSDFEENKQEPKKE